MKFCLQYHHLLPFFRKVDAYGVVNETKLALHIVKWEGIKNRKA